jgi:hypothetical protein
MNLLLELEAWLRIVLQRSFCVPTEEIFVWTLLQTTYKNRLIVRSSPQFDGVAQHMWTCLQPYGKAFLSQGSKFKRVIVTPAVYPRLVEFLHFDIQSTGQKSHCVNTTFWPSQCYVLIRQSDSPCPYQF